MASTIAVPDLYLEDETAWLELMAERIKAGALQDLDFENLGEYLSDMAIRDRREVKSRLMILLEHILKWEFQPQKRSRSWLRSIVLQRNELESCADRGVLRQHAENELANAYRKAVELAVAETGLTAADFPPECRYTLDEILDYHPSDG